jgi:hypothetical protein
VDCPRYGNGVSKLQAVIRGSCQTVLKSCNMMMQYSQPMSWLARQHTSERRCKHTGQQVHQQQGSHSHSVQPSGAQPAAASEQHSRPPPAAEPQAAAVRAGAAASCAAACTPHPPHSLHWPPPTDSGPRGTLCAYRCCPRLLLLLLRPGGRGLPGVPAVAAGRCAGGCCCRCWMCCQHSGRTYPHSPAGSAAGGRWRQVPGGRNEQMQHITAQHSQHSKAMAQRASTRLRTAQLSEHTKLKVQT